MPFQPPQHPLMKSANLFPDSKLTWQISQDDQFLVITLGLQKPRLPFSTNPYRILLNMASVLVLETCCHEAGSRLRKRDHFCDYTSPALPLPSRQDNQSDTGWVGMVAVDGNNGLRMITLCAYQAPFPVVLRGNACLQCCLDICRRASYPVIVC